MSARHTVPYPKIRYTAKEMENIKRGFFPTVMEQKWFLYFTGDRLRMHRSWTDWAQYCNLVPAAETVFVTAVRDSDVTRAAFLRDAALCFCAIDCHRHDARLSLQRCHRHVDLQHLLAAAQHQTAHWRHVAEIATPAERDVLALHEAAVGGVEVHPAAQWAKDRHPGV